MSWEFRRFTPFTLCLVYVSLSHLGWRHLCPGGSDLIVNTARRLVVTRPALCNGQVSISR